MQLTYLTPPTISNRQTLIVRRKKAFCKFHTFFRFCLPWFETKNKIKFIVAPKHAFTHRNLTESEKNIWIIQKYMKSLDSFILTSRDNWVACNQTLGCLRLYGDSQVLERSINAYEILLQHDWLCLGFFFLFFFGGGGVCGFFLHHVFKNVFYFTYLDNFFLNNKTFPL